MAEQFQEKAQKLMSKLSNIQSGSSVLHSRKNDSFIAPKNTNSNSAYSFIELNKFQEEIQMADDQNKRKTKILQEEIAKLQTYLLDQNDARNKISENFVLTATKVQKNMKLTLQGISKTFEQKEKKLQLKIEQILNNQRKQLQGHLNQNESLISEVTNLSKHLTSLEQQLQQMKRSRYQLEEKIYKQFIDQIKELKKIYERDMKERQERQNQLIQCLKGVYSSLMQQIRKQELERQKNQKGFLTVVEQIITRIVDY